MLPLAKPFAAVDQDHRRWSELFQFKLRSLLIVMTVFCLWFGVVTRGAQRRARAIAALDSLHADVVYDWQVRHHAADVAQRSSSLPIPPGPEWLRSLLGPHYFGEVVHVRLNGRTSENRNRRIDEVGWALAELRSLTELSLAGWELTPDEWQALAQIRSLEKLSCLGMTLDMPGAAQLATSTSLREIVLNDMVVAPEALQELAKIVTLKKLQISASDTELNPAIQRLRQALPHCTIIEPCPPADP